MSEATLSSYELKNIFPYKRIATVITISIPYLSVLARSGLSIPLPNYTTFRQIAPIMNSDRPCCP